MKTLIISLLILLLTQQCYASSESTFINEDMSLENYTICNPIYSDIYIDGNNFTETVTIRTHGLYKVTIRGNRIVLKLIKTKKIKQLKYYRNNTIMETRQKMKKVDWTKAPKINTGRDKILHFLAGYAISIPFGNNAIVAATIVGLLKELYDSTGKGTVDKYDVIATGLGGVINQLKKE